ncbi:MAG: selenocysteine-specific translation elongation factor [Phycisphaerales bacterium JB039]
MTAVTLGTAGHIDHGKTSLVRALTGVDTDRLPEEKRRGVTIDLGFAHLDVGGAPVGIVDVPGHERFVRNMLAGASGVDVAMLVVAADDSVMPQTAEHLAILDMLDVSAGLIALTKIDLVEPSWLDMVEQDIRQAVRGTFLEPAPIVRCSAHTGVGLEELKVAIGAACRQARGRSADGPFRLAVDRSFVREGSGTVVTGTVWSGSAAVGAELEQQPHSRPVRIRGLQSHGAAVERIEAGQRAAILLSGVHHSEIGRGDELTTPGMLAPAQSLLVRLRALAQSPLAIRHRMRVRLHLGTREVGARVRLLEGRELAPGQSGLAQLICAEPVVALGRQPLVIRAESPVVTIGGGRVLLGRRMALPRRREATLVRLAQLESGACVEAASWLRGLAVHGAGELVRDTGLGRAEVDGAIEGLCAKGALVPLGAGLLHSDRAAELDGLITRALEALHEEAPAAPALPLSRLLQRLDFLEKDLVEQCARRLADRGEVALDGGMIALAGRGPKLSPRQKQAAQRLLDALDDAGFSPPTGAALASALDLRDAELRQLLEMQAALGQLAHLGAGLYLHSKWEAELRRRVIERLAGGASMLVADLRDLLGTSRKYAVPICEYLDRIGMTRRVGDERVLGPRGREEAAQPASAQPGGVP